MQLLVSSLDEVSIGWINETLYERLHFLTNEFDEILVSIQLCEMSCCLSPFWATAWNFVLAVHRCTSFRPQMTILPSTDNHLSIVHRPVTDRSTPSDRSFNAQWLSVHRPVNDGKVFNERRNNLGFSVIMTKFETLRSLFMKYSVHNGTELGHFVKLYFSCALLHSQKNKHFLCLSNMKP